MTFESLIAGEPVGEGQEFMVIGCKMFSAPSHAVAVGKSLRDHAEGDAANVAFYDQATIERAIEASVAQGSSSS